MCNSRNITDYYKPHLNKKIQIIKNIKSDALNDTKNKTEKELNDLKEKYEELLSMKERINQGHRKFYNKKFVVKDTMTEDEKQVIKRNKYHRNSLARQRYNRSPEQQRKAKERATQRYLERLSDEERVRYWERKKAREMAKEKNSTDDTKA